MDSDDEVSLNSTEPEDYGDKEFDIRTIHAEKIDEDGIRKWLVAWDGYLSDDNLWLPKESFTEEASLDEWEAKKRKIDRGLIKPYPWKEWDRRQANLEHQRAIDKQRRQKIRLQKRKDTGATKRNGRWLNQQRPHYSHDWKRARSSSDESYVDDDDEIEVRPLKRAITVDYSDSDDDKPLISLRASTASPKDRDVAKTKVDKGKGVADHRKILNLPIRTSQSPLPTDRLKESVALATNKHKADVVERILPEQQTQGKSTLTVPNEASTSKISPQPIKRTAVRSSMPKSQSIFNIPKRLLDKKGKSLSVSRTTGMPVSKDFYGNLHARWASERRGRDEPAPNVNNLHLVSIPSTTEGRGRQFNRIAGENVDPDQSNLADKQHPQVSAFNSMSPAKSNALPVDPSTGRQGNSDIGDSREQQEMEKMDIEPPTSRDSTEKELSLFVGGSQEPTDGAVRFQPQPDGVSHLAERTINPVTNGSSISNGRMAGNGSNIPGQALNSRPEQSSNYRAMEKENAQPMDSRSAVQDFPADKSKAHESRDASHSRTNSRTGFQQQRVRVEIDGITDIPLGTLSSIEYLGNNYSGNGLSFPCELLTPLGSAIQTDMKDLKYTSLQSLFQNRDNGTAALPLILDQKCISFKAFLNDFHQEHKHMYFAAGGLQARAESESRARFVHEAWICFKTHFALLIWPTKSEVWSPITQRFLGTSSIHPAFGYIMFQPSNSGKGRKIQAGVEAETKVVQDAPMGDSNVLIKLFSERGKQLIENALDAPVPYSDKLAQLNLIFADTSSFSSATTEEQKIQLFWHIAQWVPKDDPLPVTSTTANRDDDVQSIRDPRLLRRQSNAAELTPPQMSSPPQDGPKLSFHQLQEQYLKGEPYTAESAISMFEQLFGIDWERMTGGKHLKVPVMMAYVPGLAPSEPKFLEDHFLSWVKARPFSLTDQDWKAFRELCQPIARHIDQSGVKSTQPFDPEKHAKLYTGAVSILLVHECLEDLRFRYYGDLWSLLRNPNFKIFRISLGEPYRVRNAIQPRPGVRELARDGQYILVTDSVFVSDPQDVLLIFKYLSLKLEGESSVMWKIFGRPGLANWLLKLQDTCQGDPSKVAAYAEIHAYINKLVPYEQRRSTHLENEWIPVATAALEIPVAIEGYIADPRLTTHGDEKSDLAHNDELLVEWFGQATRKSLKQIRSLVVVLDDQTAQEKGKAMSGTYKHVRIISSTDFVGMKGSRSGQVRSTLLQAEWKRRASEQIST